MAKWLDDEKRRNSEGRSTESGGSSFDAKKFHDELEAELKESFERLNKYDPETLKKAQEKLAEHSETLREHGKILDSHGKTLDSHEERIAKLEKAGSSVSLAATPATTTSVGTPVGAGMPQSGASAATPIVSTGGAQAFAPMGCAQVYAPMGNASGAAMPPSDYDLLYPKEPTPSYVRPAYYVRLGNGKEILRYLEADAIRIANTEEFGVDHRDSVVVVDAWSDAGGRLIRPLTPEESEKFRRSK